MKDRPQKNKAGRSIVRQGVMIALCLMILGPKYAHTEPLTGLEYNAKAGFIYNFAKFVEWPPDVFENNNVIDLCFVSDDPSSDVLFKLNDKIVSGKKIKVRK